MNCLPENTDSLQRCLTLRTLCAGSPQPKKPALHRCQLHPPISRPRARTAFSLQHCIVVLCLLAAVHKLCDTFELALRRRESLGTVGRSPAHEHDVCISAAQMRSTHNLNYKQVWCFPWVAVAEVMPC